MAKNLYDGGTGNPADLPSEENGIIRSPARTLELANQQLWTTEQLLEAEPFPMIEVSEEDLKAKLSAQLTEAEKLILGGEPEATADDDTTPTATSGGYNYPPPFTRYEVFDDYKVFPYCTIGKLFFRINGNSYVASAASMGNYAIWTAGHCVHAGDNKGSGWATDVVFVPAYKDGSAPFGQWPASYLMTRTTWYRNGNPGGLTEDMGGAVLFPRSGKKISQVVGWLGFAWNWSRYQHWHAMGYPAASPFNGQRLNANAASYAYDGSVSGTDTVGIGCDMTGGCSGGPWIMRFGSGNYLNGNNSYRRSTYPQELYSPYFDNRAKSLWDALRAGTP